MMRVAVLGPGGIGGLVAAALVRAGVSTTVVAREETVAAIAERGLRLSSLRLGEIVVHPAATAHLDDDVDVLVVATRARDLDAALERVAGQPGLVVPLLDGLDHVALLRERFGPRAIVATITVESERVAPGVILQSSSGLRVELASDHPSPRPRMAAFRDRLRTAELPARLGDTEARTLWSRLAFVTAISCTTAAYDRPIGAVRDHPRARLELEGAIDEATAVANAEGAQLDPDSLLRTLWQTDAAQSSPLARDVAAGREDELETIAGAVVRRAAAHDLACPIIADLVARIRSRALLL
jgi:2-dehydropantoate 2-reductase